MNNAFPEKARKGKAFEWKIKIKPVFYLNYPKNSYVRLYLR